MDEGKAAKNTIRIVFWIHRSHLSLAPAKVTYLKGGTVSAAAFKHRPLTSGEGLLATMRGPALAFQASNRKRQNSLRMMLVWVISHQLNAMVKLKITPVRTMIHLPNSYI